VEPSAVDGGNIVLNLSSLLLLRNGSQISTEAGTEQAGGNGGNITINSPLIIAIPEEDSNIIADAFEGSGGNVNITARGIFGIEPRPNQTPLSDITASSELGIDGTIALSVLDTSFVENDLSAFDSSIINTANLTSGSCIARADDDQGSFVVTGGGGLPTRPSDNVISTFATGEVQAPANTSEAVWSPGEPIVEPTGVFELASGRLVLSRECESR
jgi:large exoprotein involved in heme utilization and adhesion